MRYELKSSKVRQCFSALYTCECFLCFIYVVFVGIEIRIPQLTNPIQAIFTFVKALNINVDFRSLQMIESFSISFFSPFFCSLLLLLLLFCFCLFFDGTFFLFLFASVVQVHSHYNVPVSPAHCTFGSSSFSLFRRFLIAPSSDHS